MRQYKIYSAAEELWWSNEDGWVSLETATLFSLEDRLSLHLPIGGMWICVERED